MATSAALIRCPKPQLQLVLTAVQLLIVSIMREHLL